MDAHINERKEKYIITKTFRKPEKSINLMERLKLQSELKFTMSGGNVFSKHHQQQTREDVNANVSVTVVGSN